MVVRVGKSFRFEASHVLPKHPGKCSRLHGHSWTGQVVVEGPVDPETGFVVDYTDLGYLLEQQIILRCDHVHLGQGLSIFADTCECPFGRDFYPSSENLVVAFARILQPLVKELPNSRCELVEVRLKETCTSEAVWQPDSKRKVTLSDGTEVQCDQGMLA